MTEIPASEAAEISRTLAAARRIVVVTGSGMSAESGIPTFRGPRNGLWARFEPEQLATAEAFTRDRKLVWGWYRWRTALVEQAEPNAGHFALAELAELKSITVVTQNVDNLHERAGSSDVIHVHGSLFAPRCFDCGRGAAHEPAPPALAANPERRIAPPACTHCGGPIRPGVVWFGESLPERAWRRAVEASQDCDAMLVVGTSALVHPVAGLPMFAKGRGTPVIEINPEETALSGAVDTSWRTTAAQGLPALLSELKVIIGDD